MQVPDGPSSHRDFSMFADGELDADAARRFVRRLVDEPAAAVEVSRVQQLSRDARRAVLATTPPPSAALLDRIQMRAMPAAAASVLNPTASPTWWRYVKPAIAAAILLAVGAGVERWARPRSVMTPHPSPTIEIANVLPADIIAGAEEVHSVCSRLALGLHTAGYPADVASLAGAVEHDLHSDHPYPDLSAIGYRYRGAGPCGRPLPDAAHLLYVSKRPGSVNAVSVFVQPWRGQYPLAADRVYTVSIAQSPFPMLAWRTDAVVYFLLADDAATEQAALHAIREPAAEPTR